MKSIIKILIAIIGLSSCDRGTCNEGTFYSDFLRNVDLKGIECHLDSVLLRYPFRIRIQDNKMAVMDLHNEDYFCHVFGFPDFNHISSFGKRGESPEEQISIENIRFNGNSIVCLDASKSELVNYKFELSDSSMSRNNVIKLDKSILRPLDFTLFDDSTIIIPDYSGENRFCVVSKQGKLNHKFGTIPTSNTDAMDESRPALAQAWRSLIDYNSRNGVLAAVTQLGEVLEIYNMKDNTHVVCKGPDGEPKFEVSQGYGIPTGIMGFSDVQVTDSAIYTVFHGVSFKELAQNDQKGIHIDGGRFIYKFSLKGEPLCKYILDHYVYGISVNETTGTILATDVNRDKSIIRYKIK